MLHHHSMHLKVAASKALLHTQSEETLKCISDYRFVNSQLALLEQAVNTIMPGFCNFMFGFGENSEGFLEELFCHLCYRVVANVT